MEKQDNVQALFSPGLLDQPPETRLRYLRDQLFQHTKSEIARKELIKYITSPTGKRTINFFGPTGVGKTTVIQLVKEHFEIYPQELRQDGTQRGPLVSMSAFADEPHRFGWKEFYDELLKTIVQAYPQVRIDFDVHGIRYSDDGKVIIADDVTVFKLRRAVVKALLTTKPIAVLVDEAPHINKLVKGTSPRDQMDIIKSLTEESKTLLVLIGTYDLLKMTNLNGQQGRRSKDVHMPRYCVEEQEDIKHFRGVLRTLQRHLPLRTMPDLLKQARYLYVKSLGCVGILKPWVDRAFEAALDDRKNKANTLLKKHLEMTEEDPGGLYAAADEIERGERKLREMQEESDRKLREVFGTMAEPETPVENDEDEEKFNAL